MTTVVSQVHFKIGSRGRKSLRRGEAPTPPPLGRVPRAARLMALAIRMDKLVAEGGVANQAELAEVGRITRARVSQILNLLHLAPDIQEALLFLPDVSQGRDPITERHLRPIAAEMNWGRQRAMWARLLGTLESTTTD